MPSPLPFASTLCNLQRLVPAALAAVGSYQALWRHRSTKPQVTAAYKEGLYQKTAGPWMEDITAVLQPLPFNLSQVGWTHY
jgi:hypothetical protein